MRERFGDAVGDTLRSVLLFLPKAVAFVAILVVGWLIAKAVLKVVDKVLERVGFDRAVERGGIRRALARSRYDASDIVARLAYYGVLLVTLQLAFGIWGPNPISDLIAGVIAWLPRAFVAIVIVVVAAAIANAVKDIVSGALGGLSYGRFLATLASAFILGLGVIAALNQIGVATAVTTPVLVAVLATVGGILVVGVGGGLVRPMQSRWESWLTRAEQESRLIATHARAYQAGRRDSEAHLVGTPGDGAPAPGVDPEATQVVSAPRVGVDPEATQVVSARRADADPDTTQVVPGPRLDADPTVPVPRQGDPEATQVVAHPVPARPAGDDSEATMVIPPVDEPRRR
ncbi:mechanosensitive ion channel family protein [Micromonospora sp. CPCC 205561]|uniref:mechanosensitive ion channel family protein n=1 Tax=Micromonospora sp. CPCC 205561 TaxID=3122407 RepID=UPI002FF2ED55